MALTERLQILMGVTGADSVSRDFGQVGGAAGKLDKDVDMATKGMGRFSGGSTLAAGVLKAGLVAGAAVAASKLYAFGKSAVQAASDLGEMASKSAAVFGSSAADIDAWAAGAADSFGLSKREALEAASGFGNMFTQLGIGSDQAANMSKGITELAADFASFHNADISEILTAQSAAFRGEYDSLQRFLPLINAATVEQKALELTGKATTKALTAQDKALAVNALMFEGAGKAAGDFDRTSESLANQQRKLAANSENTSATLGERLAPAMARLTGFMNDYAIPGLLKLGEVLGEGLADAAGFAIGAFADVMSVTAKALEKIDQFVPGLEGIPEAMQETVAEMRTWEASLHDMESSLGETTAAAGELGGATETLTQVTGAAALTADELAAAQLKVRDTSIALKDAQFSLTDAQRGQQSAQRKLIDAQDEYNALLATGGVNIDAVTTAQENLTRAQQDSADAAAAVVAAQEAVNEALKPADEKTKGKANRDLAAAQDDVTQAGINLRDATADLENINKDGRATADEYRAAQLRVSAAERAVEDATESLAAEELAHGQVMIAGTTVTDAYKTATDGLKVAEDAATAAKNAETVAQDALNAAMTPAAGFANALADADLRVKDAAWEVEKAAWAAQKAQVAFNDAVSDDKKAKVDNMAASVWGMGDAVDNLAGALNGLPTGPIDLVSPNFVGPLSGNQQYAPGGGGGLGGMINKTRNMAVEGGLLTVQLLLDGKVITEVVHNGLLTKQRTGGNLGFRAI